jgi:hypothetical protein
MLANAEHARIRDWLRRVTQEAHNRRRLGGLRTHERQCSREDTRVRALSVK